MSSRSSSSSIVRFGDFELDLSAGELRRSGTALKLQPQPAKVLVLLVRRAGEVVTRQDLAQQVWGSETFVDFEQGLNFAIRQIRSALEDDVDHPRFLETLPRRGYCFIAAVENLPAGSRAAALPAEPEVSQGEVKKAPQNLQRAWLVTGGLVGILLLAGIVSQFAGGRPAKKSPDAPIQSIAVLPLVNLSADPAQEYFTDGLTDEVTTELARIASLRVVSRTSANSYKGTRKRAPEIGRELGVDAIVEGTVERVGDRVRIRAQVIRAASDQHLWAESYDHEASDLLKMEGEVARDIARQVGHITSEGRDQLATGRVVSAAAHEDYLRGRYYWNKRTEPGLRQGIEYFQKAIDREPVYAPAYAGLADSYIMLTNWGFSSGNETYPKAKAAALKALELDDELAEAHTSLAYTTLLYDWNWPEAEKRFRRAIALNPNYASAHHFYSICLMTAGRQSEALAEIRRAQELDPLSLIVNDVLGWIHYEGRHYDQAIQQYRKTLEMDPGYVPALLDLGTSYLRTGEYSKAIAQFEKVRSLQGDSGVVLSGLAQAYALSGNSPEALKILNQLQQPSKSTFVSSWDLSLVYATLGKRAKSVELLRRAAEEHAGWVVRLGVDPALDGLRDEPAFKALKQHIGIPSVR